MNTDILINNTDEIQQEIDLETNVCEDELETTKPQMLEVVSKDFQGRKLIID
jgi:hypothetical protein